MSAPKQSFESIGELIEHCKIDPSLRRVCIITLLVVGAFFGGVIWAAFGPLPKPQPPPLSSGSGYPSDRIQRWIDERQLFQAKLLRKDIEIGIFNHPRNPVSGDPDFEVYVGPNSISDSSFYPGQKVTIQYKIMYHYEPSLLEKLPRGNSSDRIREPVIAIADLFVVNAAGAVSLLASEYIKYSMQLPPASIRATWGPMDGLIGRTIDGQFTYLIPTNSAVGEYKLYAVLDDRLNYRTYSVYRVFYVRVDPKTKPRT